jgi:oxygen-independent coproporphyrinogen-3 oxidase
LTVPVAFVVRAEHLYIHVPFCARRCVYCDFSIAVRNRVPDDDYVAAVDRELELRHQHSVFELATVYFGGGTPSKLAPESIGRMLDLIRTRATLHADAEITLEANPEDVTSAGARAWRGHGVNRVSLGVQSFEPDVLSWMHRTHDAEQIPRAVDSLRDAGIENISVDLIFAVPAMLGRVWERDIAKAVALGVPHLSVYGLTVESHTPLGRWIARESVAEAAEESFESEFLAGNLALERAGFEHYEVSNYGWPGRESRHNSAYWERRPYVGIGPSAHEFDGTNRRWNVAPYAEWVRRIERGDDPIDASERLEPPQEVAERVYLGLRTARGLDVTDAELAHMEAWVESGWARQTAPGHIRLTALGWLRLDALAADLTHFRSRY